MKCSILPLTIIFCVLFILLISCDDEEDSFSAQGYVIGFDPCITRSPYEIGEGLLITTSKDTFLTYNLPEELFDFPDSLFLEYQSNYFFSENAASNFGVKFLYRYASEKEEKYPLCSGSIFMPGFERFEQIIILSAEKKDK